MTQIVDTPAGQTQTHSHPRTVGWFGPTCVAMGGINQSLFLMGALFIGQGSIPGQGSAAVPILIIGLLLSWAATPGWTELIMLYPNRVGGIAGCCAEAFRPLSPVLANLTGVCYWWGWVPTCGLTALLSASALQQLCLPWFPVPLLASLIVALFTVLNLAGIKWVMRLAMPIAILSGGLAFISAFAPMAHGDVDWHRAFDFHLTIPFPGEFGKITSFMAGLYLVGFGAPAFEQAACHVGETINPEKNVPRAMYASAAMASLYFVILPIIWLGTLGADTLGGDLASVLGPTFAPIFGSTAKAAAIWFMVMNMFHGTIAPLAGAARTLAQLAEDGLLPEWLEKRSSTDAPWAATVFTAVMAIIFLLIGDPIWLIAAANLTYLIGIAMPNVAVWLLRRNSPELHRPYRAPKGMIAAGLIAAIIWALAVVLGFEQFGLSTVIVGFVFAYSGSAAYAWRKYSDRKKAGLPGIAKTLHLKLTGAMLAVLALDAIGYLIAVKSVSQSNSALITMLEDIFVVVALLTICVGLILPGMIAHSAIQISTAAKSLVSGTLSDFERAMFALASGDLDAAKASFSFSPIALNSADEVGEMAQNFNLLQESIGRASGALEGAREGLVRARSELTETNKNLKAANEAKSSFLGNVSHELRTPLHVILGNLQILLQGKHGPLSTEQTKALARVNENSIHLLALINGLLDITKAESGKLNLELQPVDIAKVSDEAVDILRTLAQAKGITVVKGYNHKTQIIECDPLRIKQILINLFDNAVKFTSTGDSVMFYIDEDDAAKELVFNVIDTGIGIAPADQQRIFREFEQLDARMTRSNDGVGLGLSIARRLAQLHGGDLHVESSLEKGSRFILRLPIRDVPTPEGTTPARGRPYTPPPRPNKPSEAVILAVEDYAPNLEILTTYLELEEFKVLSAATGTEGVALAKSKLPDLIIMDVKMPGMDGLEATRIIKADPATRHIPVIMLTAFARESDKKLCMEAGASSFLSKPVDFARLSALIAEYLKFS